MSCLVVLTLVGMMPGLEVHDTGYSGLSASIDVPSVEVVESPVGRIPIIPGWGLRYEYGEPIQPAGWLYVPVPPDVEASLRFSVGDLGHIDQMPSMVRGPAIEGRGLESSQQPTEAAIGPSAPVRIEGYTYIDNTRVAMIGVYPMAGFDRGSFARSIELRLDWPERGGWRRIDESRLLYRAVPRGSVHWPEDRGPDRDSPFWGKPWLRLSISSTGGYLLTGSQLEAAGGEILGSPSSTLRMLTGPGVEFGTDPSIEHGLTEVDLRVEDVDGDGLFESEDSILFLGRSLERWSFSADSLERLRHRYSEHNVYWLTWGGETGGRIDSGSAQPDGSPSYGSLIPDNLWLEEENVLEATYEIETGWVWEILEAGEDIEIDFDLPGVEGSGDIVVNLISVAAGAYTVEAYLNGSLVGSDSWGGIRARSMRIEDIPLQESNSLYISFSEGGSSERLAIDHVQVSFQRQGPEIAGHPIYPGVDGGSGRFTFDLEGTSEQAEIFDVTDPFGPILLSGTQHSGSGTSFSWTIADSTSLIVIEPGQYMAPDSILPAAPGRILQTMDSGDRLFVVPEMLSDDIWGLYALSESMGHSPAVATTREIYDEFNAGVTDPGAIRSMIRWAQQSWSPQLSGVILVGDGHYDPLGHLSSGPSLIPPYTLLSFAIRDGGKCSDDYYVMTHPEDVLPEMPIGRIPAGSSAELGTVTGKALSYVSGSATGSWMNRFLLLADDEWGNDSGQD